MDAHYSIQHVVKVLNITKPGQVIKFQVRHPENASVLTSISISTNLKTDFNALMPPLRKQDLAGQIELFIADTGDLAFTEDVRVDDNNCRNCLEDRLHHNIIHPSFGFTGVRRSYFEANYRIKHAMMEGLYANQFKGTIRGGYQVVLYLIYELNNLH